MSCSRILAIAALTAACHHGHEEVPGDGNTVHDVDAPSDGDGGGGSDGGTHVTGAFCVEDGWCWQRPMPFGTTLRAVWGSSPGDVWAVGDGGTIAHYDGSSWQLVASGTYAGLSGVWGSAADDVWAAGDAGTLLHWGGSAWSSVTSPTTATLRAVYGTSSTDVYAVGDGDTRLHWNGAWTALPTLYPGQMYPPNQLAVWASPSGEAWSAGIPQSEAIAHRTGGAWTTTDVASIGSVTFSGVWGSADNDVWLAGTGGQGYLQRWNGSSWSSVDPPSAAMLQAPLTVTGSGPNDVWFFGGWYGSARWNGAAFVAQPELEYEYLTAGWVHSSGDGWTVGYGGRMAHKTTLDGSWTFTGGSPSGSYDTLSKLVVLAENDAWAVGRLSIAHWDGTHWSDVAPASTTYRQEFTDVWGAATNDVWTIAWGSASPDNLQHWNGSAWQTTTHPGPSYLNAIWGSASNDIWIAYSGGNGGMHYDGHTWQTTIAGPGGDSTAMHGTATDDIWCVGLAGLMKHYDGGTWTAKPANTTASLYAVRAFSTTDAWAAGDAGTLIRWNGASWQAAPAPPLSGTDLVIDSLSGTSSTDLWAATSGGQIFHWNGSAWSRSAKLSVSIGSLSRLPSGAMFVAGGNGAILRRGP